MWKDETGSALITVIVFITIITFFLGIIFLYNTYQRRAIANLGYQTQTYYNAKSGLYLSLNEYKDLQAASYFYQVSGNDSTTVEIETYGLYLKAVCSSKIKDVQTTRKFLIGQKQDERFKAAVVMGDIRNPLIVAGSTIIRGDALVGPQGIKPGVLKGRRYKSEQTIFGAVKHNSSSQLPAFNQNILDSQIAQLKKNYRSASNSFSSNTPPCFELNNQSIVLNKSILLDLQESSYREIKGPGIVLLEGNENLNALTFSGPLIIYSEKNLILSENFISINILCFAKNIEISTFNPINGQFFSQENITINAGAHLSYPSIAAIIGENANLIQINGKAQVDGSLIISGQDKQKIIIDENANINGLTYSDKYTELSGQVNGTVLTQSFYMYMSPTVYINWLNNASIDREYHEQDMTLPLGFNLNTDYEIVIEE